MNKEQKMDVDWIKFHPSPSKPNLILPEGAVDSHCHVFGPSAEFPLLPNESTHPVMPERNNYFLYEII